MNDTPIYGTDEATIEALVKDRDNLRAQVEALEARIERVHRATQAWQKEAQESIVRVSQLEEVLREARIWIRACGIDYPHAFLNRIDATLLGEETP